MLWLSAYLTLKDRGQMLLKLPIIGEALGRITVRMNILAMNDLRVELLPN
nr:C746 [uncultured bacterium]